MIDIIKKLEKENITGMGGANFSTSLKWQIAKEAESDTKYIVCNASEGEPGVKKDRYILKNYLNDVISGINIAKNFLEDKSSGSINVKSFLFLNHKYYFRLKGDIDKALKNSKISLFVKSFESGYIAGEETSLLNAIEGVRVEPRLKPPYPTSRGLWDCPTIINNVETFYNIGLLVSNEYKSNRFYTISGDCENRGTYSLSNKISIEKILKETGNFPLYNFFVQVGGNASGSVFNKNQLKRKSVGVGSITIYKIKKHNPIEVIREWLSFYLYESCGQCTSGREGIYRLHEIINNKEHIKWGLFFEVLNFVEQTSFCPLCGGVSVPIKTYIKNVLAKEWDEEINISKKEREVICSILK